jgi:putative phosphoesterase
MKIGVLADTHIPISAKRLPDDVISALKTCDLIIHAGDIVEMSFYKELEHIAPLKAVSGNMDSPELQGKLPDQLIVELEGRKIGVTHGKGNSSKVCQYVRDLFDKKVDIIIFGHSHTPLNEKKGNMLLFNPGSPTDKIFAPYRSFGIIEISKGDIIRSEIVKIED